MKGVILAGGFGTRLYPLTKVTNKHLLPVYDEPMICYPIQTLLKMGITEIMIVTGIEFAGDFLRLLGEGEDFIKELNKWNNTQYPLINFHYAVQKGAGGIADALRLAEIFAGKEPIAVILGDNVFEDDFNTVINKFSSGAMIFLKNIKENQRFGVPVFDESFKKIIKIEEKPQQPKSPFAVTGLYIYDSRVFEIIKTLTPSARGELEITDVNNCFIEKGEMAHTIVNGFWSDAGTIETLYSASCMIRNKIYKK